MCEYRGVAGRARTVGRQAGTCRAGQCAAGELTDEGVAAAAGAEPKVIGRSDPQLGDLEMSVPPLPCHLGDHRQRRLGLQRSGEAFVRR